jgi:hypothetical protein
VSERKHTVVDFETKSIDDFPRPLSPPPVGLAIWPLGMDPLYFSFDHPVGTNGVWTLRKGKLIEVTKGYPDIERAAKLMLKDAYRGKILGHNIFKFDCPVAEDHWKLRPPTWSHVDDTQFSLFLRDPHSPSLALKPAAEFWLEEPPDERDAVFDWLAEKGIIGKPDDGVTCKNPKDAHQKGVHAKNKNCVDPVFVRKMYQRDAGGYISKAPGKLVAAYAIGDLTRTWGLWDEVHPWVIENGMREAYDRERQLAPVLLDNERRGVRVDMEALERDLPPARRDLQRAEEWFRKTLAIKDKDFWYEKEKVFRFNFDSDAHIAQALRTAKIVEEFPQTAGGRDSVSKKVLRIDHFSNAKVYHALHYRNTLASILGRMEKFYLEGSKKNGYIFREWQQVRQGYGDDMKGARSGRVTVGEFANMSKAFGNKDPDYKHPKFLKVNDPPLARIYLLADPGEEFGHSDFDQQEMKIIAHYEDGALAKQYCNDPKTDIHAFVHDLIQKVTGKDYNRDVVKTLDFRKAFGSGTSGFAEQIRESHEVAQEIIDSWEAALPDVVELDKELRTRFKEGGSLRTLGGRLYFCKPPAIAKKGARKGMMVNFFYTALNYLIQPSAADQTKKAIIMFYNHPKRTSRMLATVYDEINISMADRRQLLILQECMINAFKLDVPTTTTLKAGPSWGKLKKLDHKLKEAA